MTNTESAEIVAAWLAGLESAANGADDVAVAELFDREESFWRDVVSLTWTLQTSIGAAQIAAALRAGAARSGFRNLRIASGRTAPQRITRVGREVIEAFYEFDTDTGSGTGIVRLQSPSGTELGRAWMLLTTLQELKPEEKPESEDPRAGYLGYERAHVNETWPQYRARRAQRFEDDSPEVLIVGAGHSGLSIAARLETLGVDALAIDTIERVGDTWRNRYESLSLHTLSASNQLPYMPFPSNWPRYLTKDKLGDFLEMYAESMELNIWTSTEFLGAEYDEAAGRWYARILRDGEERVLQPKHIVLATGGVGRQPRIPDIPGLGDFAGQLTHSGDFRSGADYAGKRVLVVGVATSAHDIALTCSNYGADVTMLQRGPTIIISIEVSDGLYAPFEDGTPLFEADLFREINFTGPVLKRSLQAVTKMTAEQDRELIAALNKAGLKTYFGSDGTGFQMKAFRTGGGYYINVGASEKIVSGDIKIEQYENIDRVVPGGLEKNGTVLPFDAIVLATGFEFMHAELERFFGSEVAEKVGPIFVYDEESYEMSNSWKPVAQEGLWFIPGGFAHARSNSLYLALQLQARLRGLVPAE